MQEVSDDFGHLRSSYSSTLMVRFDSQSMTSFSCLALVFGAVEISALRRAVIHYNKKQKTPRGVYRAAFATQRS